MAQPTRAASSHSGGRSPVTSMALAALFALLCVLGLQNGSAQASPGTPTPVAAAVHHGPAGAGGVAPARSAAAGVDTRSSTDDACTTDCGQPPRVGRTTLGEWHVPSPGGVPVPPGPRLCLPEPGPQLPLAPGAPTPPQPSASHSGRGPPSPTGI
ncbi:hypothetical protein O1Q96_20060 [Streptomyces sp. Qhu-G9]|uniref:hypothetical protein n=1 Tax=Streptomyces sp. Qhu-G9 TaxID=3452799 RepID=UPI0022AC4D3F|nr:hypothetical protein [Streptomyces aurantiacus]WAU81877.1 hypothetical protein O1Q96_20060 [Streptomyces aurantiacus]